MLAADRVQPATPRRRCRAQDGEVDDAEREAGNCRFHRLRTLADFHGADLRGADLTGSIFLVQSQFEAATGDIDTKLPPSLARPAHWSPVASCA